MGKVALVSLRELAPLLDSAAAQTWATKLNQLGGKAVEAVFALGRALIEAKDDPAIPHGDWERMFTGHPDAVAEPVRFSIRTAQCLMCIASHPLLSKAQHVALLPPSWGTLDELTRVPAAVLEAALEDGRIRPDMKRSDAVRLHAPPPEPPGPFDDPFDLVDHLRAMLKRALDRTPADWRPTFVDYVTRVAEEVRATGGIAG
jgi:hypothetical protein